MFRQGEKQMSRKINDLPIAAIAAVMFALLLSACQGNGGDADENSRIPDMTEERATSGIGQSRYAAMTEKDKSEFVREKTLLVISQLGANGDEPIPDNILTEIKRFVDSYAARARMPRKDDCSPQGWVGSDLASIVERGSRIAPQINKAFAETEVAPQAGLYIAMIESEFCPCLQSPTGPLGLFQFTTAEGRKFGLDTKAGASANDPDERCDTELASEAEAKRLSAFVERLVDESSDSSPGKNSSELNKNSADAALLAVAAHNIGVDSLMDALKDLELEGAPNVWNLSADSDKLPEQIRRETGKYVPKFIAAAIVGENPGDFGIRQADPLSGIK